MMKKHMAFLKQLIYRAPLLVRGCGGIGRRAGFKIRFHWSVGSSPTTRTKIIKHETISQLRFLTATTQTVEPYCACR